MAVRTKNEDYEVSNKIFTLPNLLSFIRFCMIPAFLVLLLNGYNLIATILFAVAASTDWIDGQVARRTNSVSKLGQLLDPFVDFWCCRSFACWKITALDSVGSCIKRCFYACRWFILVKPLES